MKKLPIIEISNIVSLVGMQTPLTVTFYQFLFSGFCVDLTVVMGDNLY